MSVGAWVNMADATSQEFLGKNDNASNNREWRFLTNSSDKLRLVCTDEDAGANEFIDRYSNRDLFVNAVNWSLGDVEAISIRPNVGRASRFALSTQQFQRIRSLSLFVLPEGIAVLGVLTWWSRRRALVT